MRYLFSIVLCLFYLHSPGQASFYDYVPLGPYQVGYCDTILFNESIPYSQFGYTGASPMFVQIWHPLEKQSNRSFLHYGDFRKRNVPEQLKFVYSELSAHLDTSFIQYNLSEELSTYETLDFGPYAPAEVLNSVKSFETRSSYSKIDKKLNFPVILYHHGSQGLSDENFIMAEYFASRGYIFVSANFHLPYDNKLPFGLEEGVKNDHSAVKVLTAFAKALTNNDKAFYVGHSWGAQAGWCYLYEPGWADAFVSMETTIEFKKDSLEIKDKWPFVYDAVKIQKKTYAIPILMFANTQEDKPFPFFENIGSNDILYVSAKDSFEHDSYNCTYLMRYFFRAQFEQPDTELLKKQIGLYAKHLKMIDAFFHSVLQKEPFDREIFKGDFYIN